MSVPINIVKKTQDSLGKHVKKPPLTEKLLNKPPFRFLHDIISAVIRDSGILTGLYDISEMKSENVKDKEGKIKYLEKAIDCISFALGENLNAKPSKIVSGQEPAKTNEFLQALAQVIDKKIDTSIAVEKVLNGEKPGKSTNPKSNNNKSGSDAYNNRNSRNNKLNGENTNKKPRDSSRNSNSNSRKNSLTGNGSGPNSREPSKTRESKSPSKKIISRSNSKDNNDSVPVNGEINGDLAQGLETVIEGNAENGINHKIQPLTNGNHTAEIEPEEPQETKNGGTDLFKEHLATSNKHETEESISDKRKSSASSSRTKSGSSRPHTGYGKTRTNAEDSQDQNSELSTLKNEDTNGESATPQRPGSAIKSARPRTGRLKSAARPPSARRPAPRLKEKNEVVTEETVQHRPTTGKVANVIVDDGNNDDDADEFLVQEAPKDNLDLDTENTNVDVNNLTLENGDHGALVQQILDTKKELEDGNTKPKNKGVEIERESGISDFNRQRERESTQREIQKLKDSIQTLTRSANPLGKLMDFLQEDVDSMQRELETWRNENRELQSKLRAEENLTQQSIEPLKSHLTELESSIQEQLDKISTVKSNILKNDEKIARMVASIGVHSK